MNNVKERLSEVLETMRGVKAELQALEKEILSEPIKVDTTMAHTTVVELKPDAVSKKRLQAEILRHADDLIADLK